MNEIYKTKQKYPPKFQSNQNPLVYLNVSISLYKKKEKTPLQSQYSRFRVYNSYIQRDLYAKELFFITPLNLYIFCDTLKDYCQEILCASVCLFYIRYINSEYECVCIIKRHHYFICAPIHSR